VARVNRARLPLLAASLAFYATFSLFPLVLLGIAGFGFALERDPAFQLRVIDFINSSLDTVFPTAAKMLHDTLGNLQDDVLGRLRTSAPTSALIGVVSLVWASSGFFAVLQTALTIAIPGVRTRGVVAQRLVAIISLFTLGPLLLLLMLAGVLVSSLNALPQLAPVRGYSDSVLPLTGAAILFTLSYRFLPAHSPGWRAAFLAAVPAAIVWQLARSLLGVLTPTLAYEATYGTLASFLLLLAWLYLSMQILLYGGVLAAAFERRGEHGNTGRLPVPQASE
jgi:membrane protein